MTKKSFQPIVVAGSGRSGTTWIHNLLCSRLAYRPIFEPLKYVRRGRGFERQYLRRDDEASEVYGYFGDVFSGRVFHPWIYQIGRQGLFHVPIDWRWWSKKPIVKMIRGNLLLAWLRQRFDVRLVFVIRHPCAVVASRRRLNWGDHLDRFLGQPLLLDDFLSEHVARLESATDPVERYALLWAVENLVPLEQLDPAEYHFCFFEDLHRSPQTELQKAFDFLDLELDRKVMAKVNKPSHTTRKKEVSGVTRGWAAELTGGEVQTILGVAEDFGLGFYGDGPQPVNRGYERGSGVVRGSFCG